MAYRSIPQSRILLTGASSGIGRALAQKLARHGVRLLLVARRRDALEALAKEITTSTHSEALVQSGDLTDPEVRRAAIQRAQQTWGGLDILVNCAGAGAHGRFVTASEKTLRQIMEVNFFAATELTRLAIPLLQEGRDPLVVNVGSILGHRAIPLNSEYCASKFALRGWSESLRAELRRLGVGVLLVSPGRTETDFFSHLLEKKTTTPWDKMQGISPDAVARQTIRAIERRKHEIIPNWHGRLLVWLNRCCPGLVDRLMNRFG